EYCKKIIEFFEIEPTREVEVVTTFKNGTERVSHEEKPNHLRFLNKFARSIGVCHDTLIEWTKRYPEFSAAYTHAKALQKEHLITCGLLGLYNPAFAKFTAINITDMRDQQETKLTGVVGTRELSDAEMAELLKERTIPCEDAIAT
ncbi:MAG: hypothetical protein IMZ70_07370, partial [Candidatus Atribacteria bacterium]|nr:hypothetical protein [Candidatus Atribacteria bacterium]